MSKVLVATEAGCLTFDETGQRQVDFADKPIFALEGRPDGSCRAVVDSTEIWSNNGHGNWTRLRSFDDQISTMASSDGKVFAATVEPALLRITIDGSIERLNGFDTIEGRSEWFGQGPPLHIRSVTVTADGGAIMTAVHVGGIPRSTDGGESWQPTIPIHHDVHEVRAHRFLPNIVAAATAYGLCVSQDAGANWTTFSEGLEVTHGLAIAILDDEVIFSVQEAPFAPRSQIWRWKIGAITIEQVLDGLPQWLDGKVDSCQIGTGSGRAAVIDGGGNLWLSNNNSRGWQCIATEVPYPFGVHVM